MRLLQIAILTTAAATTSLGTADAAPTQMNFSGRLATAEGPVEGIVSIEFSIHDAPTGGTLLWEETHSQIEVGQGLVFLALGSTPEGALDATVFTGEATYLEITVDGETLTPRGAILSVPYAANASAATTSETLGDLRPEDVARAVHTHTTADVTGTLGDEQIDCYADLLADGRLDGSEGTDVLTQTAGDGRFLNVGEAHNHDAANIVAGQLAAARFDSYSELAAAGRLNNVEGSDLLTVAQGSARFLDVGEPHNIAANTIISGTLSNARFSAYSDLVAENRLDNSGSGDLMTQAQLDARFLRSGDQSRVYGCGTYVLANFCPAGNTSIGPNCDDVPAGSYCEADGECNLSIAPNCGPGAWYFKRTE